jgi:hypothetical protein
MGNDSLQEGSKVADAGKMYTVISWGVRVGCSVVDCPRTSNVIGCSMATHADPHVAVCCLYSHGHVLAVTAWQLEDPASCCIHQTLHAVG